MMNLSKQILGLPAAVALMLASANFGMAEDWPQWRGPTRDGMWLADGILDELPDGQLPIQWSVEIGSGYNGPTVADGLVYVMDRLRDRELERILCLDSATGQQQWVVEYQARYSVDYPAGPRASVTIDGGNAYAIGAMGYFHCLDAKTGAIRWKRELRSEYDVDMPIWGIAASPLIYGDLVIQQVAGSNGACMVAFDKATGKEVWKALNEKAGYSSPIIIQQGGQDILVCWTGESLSGLDPKTGQVYWSHAMQPIKMPIGIATPVLSDDQLFVSSFYDGSLMVTADPNALESKLVWRARGESERKTGAKTVELADGVTLDDGIYGIHTMIGTPILEDGFIYAVDSYGEFRCLEAATGKRIWEDLSAVPVDRWSTIHMVRQADRVWMFNERGELLLAKLSPQGLTILDRCQLIEPTKIQLSRQGGTQGVCWSHPAFAEKSIFARNDNRIIRASLAK